MKVKVGVVCLFLFACINTFSSSYSDLKVRGYDLVERAIAPLKPGYGYTKEEKEEARKKITELEQETERAFQEYELAIQGRPEKAWMKVAFRQKITRLQNEIHEQKIITGELMSVKRKLTLAGISLVAAAIGGAIAYQYFVKNLTDPYPPYDSPARVENTVDLAALENRLQKIKQQKYVSIKGQVIENPHYNQTDELAAQKDIDKAHKYIKEMTEISELYNQRGE